MKTLLGFLLLFMYTSLHANNLFSPIPFEDWRYTLSYNFYTTHHTSDGYKTHNEYKNWNESNNITGLRVSVNENVGYFIAAGKNSYYNRTLLGGVEISTHHQILEFGFDAGLASGYQPIVMGGIVVFANPFVRLNLDITKNLTASVKVGTVNFMAGNAHFELSVNF